MLNCGDCLAKEALVLSKCRVVHIHLKNIMEAK